MEAKKLIALILVLHFLHIQAWGFWGTSKSTATNVIFPFLGVSEVKKSQIESLSASLDSMRKDADDSNKKSSKLLAKLNNDISEAQSKLKTVRDAQFELSNKKIVVLNARKQTALNTQELWKDIVDLIERHIALLKNIIEYTSTPKDVLNVVYSWKEFKDARNKFWEHSSFLDNEKKKREYLKKFVISEKESLGSLQRQIDVKTKEREKFLAQNLTIPKGTSVSASKVKAIIENIDQEVNLLNERVNYSKIKLNKFDLEEKFKEDEISFQQSKLNDERELLAFIERRLILDFTDVELVKAEWKEESQKALQLKEELSLSRENKDFERERLNLELEFLNEKIKQTKEKEAGEYASIALAKAGRQKLQAQYALLEREIQLIDARKDMADVASKIKELQYLMIDVRYRLRQERINYEELLTNFNNQKELELSIAKELRDKRIEAVGALIENKRIIERIKLKEEKLKNKKAAVFYGKEAILDSIFTHYDDAKKILEQQAQVIQDYLAVCSDVISQQEMVINHYDLIISDLEAHKITQSIWKRSPRAISLEAFKQSMLESETFLNKLFWATPTYFAPTALIAAMNSMNLWSFVLLLWFFVFFVCLFWVIKYLLGYLLRKIQALLLFYKTGTRVLYLNILQAAVSFCLDHFWVFFALVFLYLHVIFDFKYVFCSLKGFSGSYYRTVFYLISIPFFVYVSKGFIAYFKELNRKLSFLFFAEHFQDRFINLLSWFFYSTAVFIPLKCAFLTYFTGKTRFGDVLLAAYSLLIILILLFFFGKEDVLKIVPSSNTLFVWLKRKIEKYYYPVFVFIMGLLMLSNPYIGYSNLAWYLAFVVPLSLLLLYALFWLHHYIRTYSVCLFMQEDEDEIRDKFEHAKTYYGFFVIITFLILLFGMVVVLARIWGLDFTPNDLIRVLSEKWVIPLGSGNKLGFTQFAELSLFIMGGFLISSLIHKFILTKLFDILRTEPGLQNTISRILHYVLICLAILLGFVTIHLEQFIFVVGALMSVGLGLAVKDVLTDLIGGFLILLERPVEIGNFIQIDETEGTVYKIAARTTTLVTSRNHFVVIPNREMLTKIVTNWGHGRFAVGFEIDIRVAHDSNPEQVKQLLIGIIQNNQIVLRVPQVVVRLEAFEENALYFLVRAFISARRVKEQWEIASQLRVEITKAFKEHEIKLALPQRVINEIASIQDQSIDESSIAVKFKK